MSQYVEIMNEYEPSKRVNESLLHKNGFSRNGIFKCYIYKNILQLIIKIDAEENWWDYQVFNTNSQLIYPPYYVKDGNIHREVDEIEKKIRKIINKLVDAHVLRKRRYYYERIES